MRCSNCIAINTHTILLTKPINQNRSNNVFPVINQINKSNDTRVRMACGCKNSNWFLKCFRQLSQISLSKIVV